MSRSFAPARFLRRTQRHNAGEIITSIGKYNEYVGKQNRKLPNCNLVPKADTLPGAITSLLECLISNKNCKSLLEFSWKRCKLHYHLDLS